VRRVAGTAENLLPPMRDALHAHCTVGEICEVLREEWGTYDASARQGRAEKPDPARDLDLAGPAGCRGSSGEGGGKPSAPAGRPKTRLEVAHRAGEGSRAPCRHRPPYVPTR
jgi:hypothetical protein